jgi:mannose/cellobiose epimerase-like protein (N-acyl-D-glucosamine 2-epimerase family)
MRKRHGMVFTLPSEQPASGAQAQALECRQCYAKCMDEIEVWAYAAVMHRRVQLRAHNLIEHGARYSCNVCREWHGNFATGYSTHMAVVHDSSTPSAQSDTVFDEAMTKMCHRCNYTVNGLENVSFISDTCRSFM